jgi:hypothetical protein
MTWTNALFVVVGVALMGLLEWGRFRLGELWMSWDRERRQRITVMWITAAVLVVAGFVIIAIALYNNNRP